MLPVQTTDLRAMPQQPPVMVDILLLLLVLPVVYLLRAFLNRDFLLHKWAEDTMLLRPLLQPPLMELPQFSIQLQLLLVQLFQRLDLLELPLALLVDHQAFLLRVITVLRVDLLHLMLRRLLADPPVLPFSPRHPAHLCLPLRLLRR